MKIQRAHLGWARAGRGAIAGVLTGAVAVGTGQLVAGVISPGSSPVVVVGQLQIDFTPPWLKNFAVREFGGHDKEILVGGILVVLAVFAAVLGVAAMRRLWYGLAGLAVFALVGVFAAATRPGATAAGIAAASQLLCTSADGFTSGVPIQAVMDGRDALLAVAMNGAALPVAHGFPVRMVVPGLYGYVSACKWIGLGAAQGHRRGAGPHRPRSLAAGPPRRRSRHRHLAAMGPGLGRHPRPAPDRGPCH